MSIPALRCNSLLLKEIVTINSTGNLEEVYLICPFDVDLIYQPYQQSNLYNMSRHCI